VKYISEATSIIFIPAVLWIKLSLSQNPIDDVGRKADQWEESVRAGLVSNNSWPLLWPSILQLYKYNQSDWLVSDYILER